MALNLTDLFFNSGEREAFVTKANAMMRRLMDYALERNAKDVEVDTKAQQATQAATAASQDAQLAAKAKQQAESAALAAKGSADKAGLADAAAAKALASEKAAADSAQSASTSATNAAKANQIAIDNAQVAIDAAAAAKASKDLVVGSIGTAAQQAAAAAKAALEADMSGYIQQAQTARSGAEEAAKSATNSYTAFTGDLAELGVSWQNWAQQSTLHEQARTKLIQDVENALATPAQLVGRGTGIKKACLLAGRIITPGEMAGDGDFASMPRDNGVTGNAYLHLDTGVKPTESRMFYYEIYGADFSGGVVHNERIWGYIAYGGIHSQAGTNNGLAPFFYLGSNGHGYLRLKLKSQYYNCLFIDGINLYAGTVDTMNFIAGRITALTVEQL